MLTAQEQVYGNQLIAYYRSPIGNNQKKIDDFVYGDDKAKQTMIKEFLTNIVEPKKTQDLAVYQEKVNTLTTEITDIGDYIQ